MMTTNTQESRILMATSLNLHDSSKDNGLGIMVARARAVTAPVPYIGGAVRLKDHEIYEGMSVRVVGHTHGWGSVTEGEIGVITRVHGGPFADRKVFIVDFPSQVGWQGYAECFTRVTDEILQLDKCETAEELLDAICELHEDGKDVSSFGDMTIRRLYKDIDDFNIRVKAVFNILSACNAIEAGTWTDAADFLATFKEANLDSLVHSSRVSKEEIFTDIRSFTTI